jgi:hypothetical protein
VPSPLAPRPSPVAPRVGSVVKRLGVRVRGAVTPALSHAPDGLAEVEPAKPHQVRYDLTGRVIGRVARQGSARWPRLVRSAVLLGCSQAEAEDLVQAVLERCLLKSPQGTAGHGP